QRRPLFHRPKLVRAVQLELALESLDGGHVHRHLLGEFAGVASPEVPKPRLLLVEPLPRFLELDLQELGRLRRLPLADLRILLDVNGHQSDGDLCPRPYEAPPIDVVESAGNTTETHGTTMPL